VNLTRPLVSLDLEATGTDRATARIVEVGIVKRYPDDCEEVFRWLVNPEVTIPSESIRVHGYTNEIARIQPFAAVADDIAATLAGCDLVVFNGRAFDLPLLRAEFARCGVAWPCEDAHIIDAFVIYRERERRDLPRRCGSTASASTSERTAPSPMPAQRLRSYTHRSPATPTSRASRWPRSTLRAEGVCRRGPQTTGRCDGASTGARCGASGSWQGSPLRATAGSPRG